MKAKINKMLSFSRSQYIVLTKGKKIRFPSSARAVAATSPPTSLSVDQRRSRSPRTQPKPKPKTKTKRKNSARNSVPNTANYITNPAHNIFSRYFVSFHFYLFRRFPFSSLLRSLLVSRFCEGLNLKRNVCGNVLEHTHIKIE